VNLLVLVGSKSQEASWLLEKWMQLATAVLVQAFATLGNKKVLGGAFYLKLWYG